MLTQQDALVFQFLNKMVDLSLQANDQIWIQID